LQRLYCLDGLRGLLAAYVMVSHMAPFAVMPGWLAGLLSHGGAGVDAFFVLSGLVIVQSLQAHGWRRGRFLAARAWRIFPVYLPALALAVAAQGLDALAGGHVWSALPWIAPDSPARSIWSIGWPTNWAISLSAHLTMTHGLFPNLLFPDLWVGFLGAAWSLSTEWQFYALAALLAPWLRRGRIGLPGLAALLLALGAAGAAWQAWAPPGLGFSRAFLPNKAAYFALGVASAALLRAEAPAARAAARAAFAAVLAATLLLAVPHGAAKAVVPLLWVVCLAAQCGAPGLGRLARLLTARPLLWLGAVSYPLYLVNEPVQKLLGRALAARAGGDGVWFSLFWVPGALLLPLGLAWALHAGVEAPAMRRFRARGRPAQGGIVADGVAAARADTLCAAPGWISQTLSRAISIRMPRSRTG
jgi:peptidoglycan/LPS O-acetylase OafA/YrhL